MACSKEKECICPKTSCPHHKICCECLARHLKKDTLPFCAFPDNDGDKSFEKFYIKLKERFEK
jgi:hypothetical protein